MHSCREALFFGVGGCAVGFRIVMGCVVLWWGLICGAAGAAEEKLKEKEKEKENDATLSLFLPETVTRMKIELSEAAYATLKAYQQVPGQPKPERKDVLATVREGKTVYTNVAIHLKGSYSFRPVDQKPSFTLNFDKYAPGQRFHGLDKLHLNNSVQDPTFLNERLARETFLEAGIPASRAGYATVHLNGRNLGFYLLVEGYNKRFVKRHFKSAKGNLYDGGSGGDVQRALEVDSGENPTNRTDLAELVEACRGKGVTNRFERISRILDVDRFLTFVALEVLFQHWDGYSMGPNNYRVFHDMDRDRMVFFPHGMDQLLGVGNSPSGSIVPKWDGLVAKALMGTPAGRRMYLERLGQVFTNHFVEARLQAKVDQWSEVVRANHAPGILEGFQYGRQAEEVKGRITRRVNEVRRQLAQADVPLVFGDSGVQSITGWRFRENARSAMTGARRKEGDLQILEVVAADGGEVWSSGSWRRTVLLESGRYELWGRMRAMGLPAGATNSGALLRVSGEREVSGLVMEPGWVEQRYGFEVASKGEVELICEYRGVSGRGGFDLGSLRLKRLGGGVKGP